MKRAAIFAALCFVPCGCSGGGSAPAVSAGNGGASLSSAAGGPSAFLISSVPPGLLVSLTNHSSTSHATTPASVTPGRSNFATSITIAPSNGAAPYVVTVDRFESGTQTIFYNQNADIGGSVGSISSTPLARGTALALAARETGPRIGPETSAGRAAYSASHLIVGYRADARADAVERALGVTRAYPLRSQGEVATRIVGVPLGTTLDAFAARLRADRSVVSVERDALYHSEAATPVVPNDPHFNRYDQWDMYAIGAPLAWSLGEGSPGVAIAMIDTGIDATSPDFAGGKIGFAESVLGGSVTRGLAAVRDTDGHGTNTAGIAAANANNAFGFAGAGFNAGLQIYKVFPDDTAANGYTSDALSSDVTMAIDDAVAHGARVVNLSLGSCQIENIDSAQQAAIDAALAAGVVIVAAAGNERAGKSATAACAGGSSTIDFPAAYGGVISVGATSLDDAADPNDAATAREYVASYSNAGPGLSLVAPGGDPGPADLGTTGTADVLHWIANLYTTTAANPKRQCANKSDCTALFAGTSQAVPHVSGAAALLLAANPSLSPAQVKQILIASADDIHDPHQGNGRLDIYRALATVAGDPDPTAQPANINFVAFAYVPNGTNRPHIVDVTYPRGLPVASNGSFRIADVPANVSSYKIGVWYDANGDGVVDAGDYFGSSQTCSANAACPSAAGIVVAPVPAGYTL